MYHIGILIYPNVEVLDFCGPFEVFRNINSIDSDADSKVFVISETKDIVNAQGLKVVPDYSFDDCPELDIIVIPGGAGMWLKEQKAYQEFIQSQYSSSNHLLSVCTGALLIAKLGLLTEGMDATTHQEGIKVLKELAPQANVLPNVRFTHSNNIIMTGGISAGIDGSLYLVSQIFGNQLALKIATYMEYYWNIKKPNIEDPALL